MEKKKKWIITGVILLVILIFGVGIYWYTRPKEVTSYTPEFETSQTKKESEKNTGNVEAGIQIPGYKTIIVAAGTKDVSVELVNPEENNVYFEISFYLPETKETIYTSKLISPGQTLYDITLDRELEAGEYPLTVQYKTYSMDEEYTPRNGAEVNCTLIAQ